MIHAKARKIDSQNPQEAANGYKNSDPSTYFGLKKLIKFPKKLLEQSLFDDNFSKYCFRSQNF